MSSAEVLGPRASPVKSNNTAPMNNHNHQPPPKNNHPHPIKQANNSGGGGGNFKRKNKHERCRKRSKSFSGCGGLINQKPVLPSKFLLGGNIKDPLNLNSLQDEEINRAMNAVTPKSSPVPTPPRKKAQIEVIIPKNIRDPLGLIDGADDAEYEQGLCSPLKRAKKKRPKKRRTISGSLDLGSMITDTSSSIAPSSEAKTPETSTDSAKIPELPGVALTANNDQLLQSPPSTDLMDVSNAAINKTTASVTSAKRDLSIDLSSTSFPLEMVPSSTMVTSTSGAPASPVTKKDSNNSSSSSSSIKPKRKSEDHAHALKKFKNNNVDKIVSPVVPQPGAWLMKRSISVNKPKHRPPKSKTDAELQMPVFKEKDKHFQYGNYNRYYGYRNPNNEIDHRLRVFSHHQYLFTHRDILDIGCNIGHVTLSVARDFRAKSVVGIDIDPKLIAIARKNVKHYVKTSNDDNTNNSPTARQDEKEGGKSAATQHHFVGRSKNKRARQSMSERTSTKSFSDSSNGKGFPNNVTFKQCNYILEDDNLLALEQPQFDVILCLSVTKWLHLNWGDDGIKQAFRRMYAQLRPGGKLILEPQNWSSYKGKKKLTETIFKNYNSIEFFPEKFREYLLSPAVGFAKSEILGYPMHQAKGFRRPIQVFTKSTMFPSERVEATPQSITYTPLVGSQSSSNDGLKTDSYVPQIRIECVEHVYTDLLDTRYCGCAEENAEINERLAEEFADDEEEENDTVKRCEHECREGGIEVVDEVQGVVEAENDAQELIEAVDEVQGVVEAEDVAQGLIEAEDEVQGVIEGEDGAPAVEDDIQRILDAEEDVHLTSNRMEVDQDVLNVVERTSDIEESERINQKVEDTNTSKDNT